MLRETLTVKRVDGLKPAPTGQRYDVFDSLVPGFGIRVTSTGKKSYVLVTRFPGRKNPTRRTIASVGAMDLSKARDVARDWLSKIQAGQDPKTDGIESSLPLSPTFETFAQVSNNFIERHVRKNKLRSSQEIERIIERELLPSWRNTKFVSIGRRDVAGLLDKIEVRGSVSADRTLAVISKICNWYAARDDDYVSPIVKGMRRSNPTESRRSRILDDDEIRDVWSVSNELGIYGGFIQFSLLTAQRKAKVAQLKISDIKSDGIWIIQTENREKANAKKIKLPDFALNVVQRIQSYHGGDFVFSETGEAPINGFSKCKSRLDARVTEKRGSPIPDWVAHDLRRTAKSIMARCKVPPHISERVLGHAIAGVEGVYDHYDYFNEKTDALQKLNDEISRIITPGH